MNAHAFWAVFVPAYGQAKLAQQLKKWRCYSFPHIFLALCQSQDLNHVIFRDIAGVKKSTLKKFQRDTN